MGKPMQKIFFGPPGCGKSFYVRQVAIDHLEIAKTAEALKNNLNMIEATFHPEYGYGDFVAKLLPKTDDKKIEYRIHAGPLVKALARAYADKQPVLLVIDEINRGNCAQIFGDIFQLLDRNDDGWSEYGVDTSDLIKDALKEELGRLKSKPEDLDERLKVEEGRICKLHLPPNLSLIGTMNTSDESVYYMDTAFKRRWDFEFMSWEGLDVPSFHKDAKIEGADHVWHDFLERLNDFIAYEFKGRSVDDKQVGIWFLKAHKLSLKDILSQGLLADYPYQKTDELDAFKVELQKVSDSLYRDEGKAAWKKCFPGVTDNQGNYIESENFEPIQQKLKGAFQIDISDEYFESLGPSQFADSLMKDIDGLIFVSKVLQGSIRNKLMFFLWDNVFSRSRKPLCVLLEKGGAKENEPRTFGAFSDEVDAFIQGVMKWDHAEHKWLE